MFGCGGRAIDSIDARRGRSATRPGLERAERRLATLRDCLHIAARTVAHPPRQAEPLGLANHRFAEADALHVSGNENLDRAKLQNFSKSGIRKVNARGLRGKLTADFIL